MYYGFFRQTKPGTALPAGFLKEWVKRQQDGLSSHYAEQGFPFNTPMWDGGVGKIVPASIVYNDRAAETPSQEAWWPYEQTAYLLDGLVRLGIVSGDRGKIELFRRNLRYVVEHPDENGLLGHAYGASDSEWPMAVFFRAVMAYCDFADDKKSEEAFVRHYRALPTEKLATGFRHINNLEGVLTAYAWSGDPALLEKAAEAYRIHDEYHSHHPEDNLELYRSKINSERNYVIHGVSFSESIKLPVLLYLHTGDRSYLEDAEKGLAEVLRRHEQIPGLPSSNEYFAGRDPLQGYETCVINDFAWSLGYFLMASGDGGYADRMEKIFFNAFPGSLLKDFSALQYLSSPNQVIAGPGANHSFFYRGCATFRQFRSDHSAQCCTGNVHRILPNYLMRMWMLDRDGAPAAVLYGPSEYSGEFRGVRYRISEETQYPCEEAVLFRFSAEREVEMPFTFRIPAWCGNASLTLNGKALSLPEARKGFCTISRRWQEGDELALRLPMTPLRKSDRYWSWYEYGPLVFSLPVDCRLTRENPSAFAPCLLAPREEWNYALAEECSAEVVRNPGGDLFGDEPPLKMKVRGVKTSGFDELEQGRYTPEVPLFHHAVGAEEELELVPYGNALLRITAFPDTVVRRSINCHQVLVSPVYPYDFTKATAGQGLRTEPETPEQIPEGCEVFEPERSGYCDLLKRHPGAENALAYLFFRFYSDRERDAFFALGASSGGEFFFGGRRICSIEPVSDAEYIAPEIVPVRLKEGYNILVAKCVLSRVPMQYRRVWGALARAFHVEECSMIHPEKKIARSVDMPGRCRKFTDMVYSGKNPDPPSLLRKVFASEGDFDPPPPEYRLFCGEMHCHSNLSDAPYPQVTPDSCFDSMKSVAKLDFGALSDHDHGGVGNAELWDDGKWETLRRKASEYYEPGRFTTLVAYERDSYPYFNNLVIYYRDGDGEMFRGVRDGEITRDELAALLKREDLLVVPHDTYCISAGADFSTLPPELFPPLMEIYSCSDCAEYFGHPLHKDSWVRGGSWHDALKRGAKMGVVGGSDDHIGTPGQDLPGEPYPFCYRGATGVWARENTREAIFDALKARRCFAYMGCDRMYLDFRINGHCMGEEFSIGADDEKKIWIDFRCSEAIRSVTLMKNCREQVILYGRGRQTIFDYRQENSCDCYYVRAETEKGRFCWSSPIWVNGKIAEAEK